MFASQLRVAAQMGLLVVGLAAGATLPASQGLPPGQRASEHPQQREKTRPRADQYGDLLPPGALARIGTVRFGYTGYILRVAFSADSMTVAAAGHNGLRLWDAATGKELQRFGKPGLSFSEIAFCPDGKILFASENVPEKAEGGRIYRWDFTPGTSHQPVVEPFQDRFSDFALSPDGKRLAAASGTTIHLYELATGKEIRRFEGEFISGTQPLASYGAPSGRPLGARTSLLTARLWPWPALTERSTSWN